MVLIIELDKEDGDRVRGLSIKLTEGIQLLFNKINGSRSFQPMRGCGYLDWYANKNYQCQCRI